MKTILFQNVFPYVVSLEYKMALEMKLCCLS